MSFWFLSIMNEQKNAPIITEKYRFLLELLSIDLISIKIGPLWHILGHHNGRESNQ